MNEITQKQDRAVFYRRIIRAISVILCLILLIAALPETFAAAEAGQGAVRVGYYENEIFQEGAKEGAVKTGYAYEYYRKLSEYTGWSYEYVYGSFSDLYQMLLDGEIDFLAGLAFREERAELIGYPDMAMGSEAYTLIKHDNAADITADASTLNGKKIGVLESALETALREYLEEKKVKAEVITFADYEDLFAAFDAGELEVLAVEGDGAYDREHAEVLCTYGKSDYYLCVNIKRPDLLEKLNIAQTELATEEPNYLSNLRSRYYSASVSGKAFSAAEKEWLQYHDTIRIGYLDNYLPYSDTDEQGNVDGLVKDLLPRMLKELNLEEMAIAYTGFKNYSEMIDAVRLGVIDTTFPVGGGLYYSEENGIYQSDSVLSSMTELIYNGEYTDDTIRLFAINENNNMQYYYVRTNFPDSEIEFYPSTSACLEAVITGKAGCTTLNGFRANEILKNSEYSKLSHRQLTKADDRCFGVRIGNEGLLKLLNRGIRVVGPEYTQNMAYHYAEGLYTYTFGDLIRNNILLFIGIILAVAAILIFFLVRDTRRTRKEMRHKEQSRQELEKKNEELAQSKEALSKALVEAEHANRAKTTFLNNMSHDIRTPMNAIVGFTTLAASHVDEPEQVKDYLGKISTSSQHLLSLINDVLDMSRIESGKVSIEEAEVHLPDVIRDIRSIVQENAADRQQDLSIEMEHVVHEDVITDKLRLNQILLNILSNAMKFTPEGGAISLRMIEKPSASPDYASFEFRIRDNGIGMSEEFQKSIFEAFTRERTSTVSGIQGTGLGMAITKNIVDMMGGTIEVESKEGEGSEFIVCLDFRICEPAAQAETINSMTKDVDFTGKKVLLAEDNELNQQIALAILEGVGFAVDIAPDGEKAVEMMKESAAGTYDVILMDIQMPHMDGYEAARQIRALEDPEKAKIPIIAVTANAFAEDRKNAEDAGMDGHLAKPYEIPKMMETLAAILQ